MSDVSPIMDQVRNAINSLNNRLIPQGYIIFYSPHNIVDAVSNTTYSVDEVAGLVPIPPPDGSQFTIVPLSK